MQEALHTSGLDERRQAVRPIGGERMQRKVTGSMMGPPNDYSDPLWGYQPGQYNALLHLYLKVCGKL